MPPKKAPKRKQVGKVDTDDDEPAAKKPRTAPAGKKVVPAPSSDNKSKQAQKKPKDNAEGLHAANQDEKLISDASQRDYFLFGREILLINDGSSLPELALVIEYQNTKILIVSMKEVSRTQLHIAVLPTDDHKVILSESVIVSLPYEHDVRNCLFLVELSEYNKWVDKCQQPPEKKSGEALVPLNTAYAITIAEESTNGEEIKRTTTVDKLGFTYETCWKGTDPVNACGNLICWLNKFGYLEKKDGSGKTSNEPFVYMKLIVYVCTADFCQLEGSDKDVLLASKTQLDIDSNAFLIIGRKYSFAHLRHYLNLSGPTLGKVLKTLEDEGLIFLGGGAMTEKSIVYLVIPPLYPSSALKPDMKHE